MDPILPIRKHLPHGRPAWVRENAVYFITVCCRDRSTNQLCHPEVANVIHETVTFRHSRGDWFVHLYLLMPDHVHALVTFPDDREMRRIVEGWKRMVAWKARVIWQRGFFDHRLRGRESFEEKAAYIRLNPCRAGLADAPGSWRYFWEPEG